MRFLELAQAFARIEATSKRLEMRAALSELLRPLRAPELSRVVYLSQGLLRPEYEGVELGVAESLARRALALATNRDGDSVAQAARTSGDLGTTAESLLAHVRRLEEPQPLGVKEVYDQLLAIAEQKGEGSQELKVRVLADLLRRAGPLEGKYLLRFVIGTLRVGVREMTILDALTEAFADGTPASRGAVEAAFNLTSDLGELAERLAEGGLASLERIHLHCGRPIRPMLAERASSLEELLERMEGRAALEYKYDGLRVQAHVPSRGAVRLFSRRLEEIGPQFPELVEAIPQAVKERPAILEGECVPVDPTTGAIRPFQEISRRRGRKYELERYQSEIPVVLFAFDVLLDGDQETYRLPFPQRRKALERLLKPNERVRLAEEKVVTSPQEAGEYFDEVVGEGAEGIVAKSLSDESAYRAGARGFWWIKYKRDYVAQLSDSIDGVVVGGFLGRGRRAGHFGAYLLAVYDPKHDRFETFCKVGSGFDDALLKEFPKRLASVERAERPKGVESALTPDAWFEPKVVIEVRGAELSRSPIHRAGEGRLGDEATGLALRFPRFTGRVRDDRGPTDATTTDELLEMYAEQQKVKARGRRVRPKA